MEDLTFLKIHHLIIHELPKRGQTTGVLSDAVSPLPDGYLRMQSPGINSNRPPKLWRRSPPVSRPAIGVTSSSVGS